MALEFGTVERIISTQGGGQPLTVSLLLSLIIESC